MKKEHEPYAYAGGIAAAAVAAGFLLFGITGARTISAMLLLFFLPSFLILSNFRLELHEKIFFSFFIGLGFFPLAAWYLGRFSNSLRLGTLLAFVLLCAVGAGLRFFKGKLKP